MESNLRVGEVCVSIDEKLNHLSTLQSECCMFRVHDQLRNVNEKAYEPEIIAIGPYHCSTITLQAMNKYKLHYFQLLLQRKKETTEKYVDAMGSLEKKTRKCYGELMGVNENELVEMMVLDGCFIIELIRKFEHSQLRDKHDPIFRMDWIVNSLQRDLMLFENQLPFFVLCKLFDMIAVPNNRNRFIDLALRFFHDLLPCGGHRKSFEGSSPENAKHLLGLIHSYWLPSFAGNDTSENSKANKKNWQSIHCATELREAGIQFVKNEECSLFDIKFENGVMHMHPLIIEDRTETFFRNLIAYEQYGQDTDFKYVTNYVEFLDNLIDSSNDVGILCRRGIIRNWLGDDEVVSNIFNKITDAVTRPIDFHYAEIFAKVNIHCNKRGNRWMAKLRRNYLNSPWGVISIAAAFILLLLTFTQSFFTVFPKWALARPTNG